MAFVADRLSAASVRENEPVTSVVVQALRAAGLSDVDDSTRRRAEYSSDASNYRVVPTAVAFPRHVDEVSAALDVATRLGVSLVSRGGGTSTAGNSVGSGIVLDFSRHLNRVLSVDADARTAIVEPGAVLDDITAAGARYGLRFGPDPSSHARATIGGCVGNNACGSRALKYGRTADNVAALDVLTGTGSRLVARAFGREGLASAGREGAALDAIVGANLAAIRTEFGRFKRQVSGYSLEHLLPERGADLARFLVGTEGTLGVVLGATVTLVEAPRFVALAVLGYPDMPTAADAVPALLPYDPVAIEGMNAVLVDVFRRRRGATAVPALPRGEGWLFVETAGASQDEAVAAAEQLVADAGALDSLIVTGAAAKALWRIREDGAGLGGRTPAGEPAWPGWEDAAVPPEHLGAYLREFAALLENHRVDGLTYGHFGDGCVHARIDFPLHDPARFRAYLLDAAQLVGKYGGSMSGEHGDGRARGELLPYMYSPEAIAAFRAVKNVFDPGNVLNPGVLVDPLPVEAHLRIPQAHPIATGLGFAYPHDGGDLSTAVHRCVGVGKCRIGSAGHTGVMCPSFVATGDEKDSTRGRARVLQELANGSLINGFAAEELTEALDLCLSCKGCSSDCPAGVDMATYKAEVLYQRYKGRLRPRSHYFLGWLPRWARLASLTPRLANFSMRRRVVARIGKRMAGVDVRRPLPAFATRTFREWFDGRPRTGSGQPVLLWADSFTNHFTPEVGQAAVRVLEAAGYRVELTEKPVCCGLTWISTGQLDGAKRQLRRSLDALDDWIESGHPIVGLEPSCTAVLRSDAAELLPDDPRAASLRTRTKTLAELLTGTPGWIPPSLEGVTGIVQPHCHQHAVMGFGPDSSLLAAAGASIDAVAGCCGLAGNFGVEEGHYEVSVKVAEAELLPAVRAAGEGTVVLADGFSCRTQLDNLAQTRGVHLAELLAAHLDAAD